MTSPVDRIFTDVAASPNFPASAFEPGHDAAALKTYRYLRIGMLVAVAALANSILLEYRQPGVHCFLGSISGYYYTPVHPVFIGVMIGIGLALIVIKGRTAIEDAFLSLAGVMAPVVAFVPTSDDVSGVCRPQMLHAGRYQPDLHNPVGSASISNDLHSYVVAGWVAIVLLAAAFVLQWFHSHSIAEYTTGTIVNFGLGLALVVAMSLLLRFDYSWVLQGHARAACAMFAFLALAAIANGALGLWRRHTTPQYALLYLAVGVAMIVFGILFVVYRGHHQSALGGRLVLAIEVVELFLFVVFWATQTIERWNDTV
jgi:hypothetical protein